MFYHRWDKVVYLARRAKEYLALTILGVFLNIKRYRLCDTEILHRLWYIETRFLCQCEIVVYSMAGGEDNGGVIVEIDMLLTKLLYRNAFNLYERSENYFDTEILRNGVIQRLITGGLWLRN